MLAAILIAGGLGAAAFHPPAAALAHRLGGDRPGFTMSVYITGGTLGFSLGPLVFAPVAQRFRHRMYPAACHTGTSPPAILHSACAADSAASVHSSAGSLPSAPTPSRWRCSTRSSCFGRSRRSTFATFVPVMLTRRGLTIGEAGASVAAYLFASGVGGFFGGPAADRFGARR